MTEKSREELRDQALRYHKFPQPGKLAIHATKPMDTQLDLALAYSPGVAFACEAIAEDENTSYDYTARSNLVGVVTNGTAVLGLGAIGALASKPVMEGKAVLFKKFADLDCFDIEVAEDDPQMVIETVARLEPTFGGINLEDIKAPDCFVIESELKKRMNIPVFHDDQHGTAIVVCAAVVNGLEVVGKDIKDVKVVASGAGAAALSCLNLLVSLGLPRENVWVSDIKGVVYEGRTELMDEYKGIYAQATDARTLDDIIGEADVFLGLSAGGVLKADMVKKMARSPLILALANPHPEILPDEAKAVRPDAILATGRSDYPNQVNNVLCFPFIFRGALDVGATEINEEMKKATVRAIAELARQDAAEVVRTTYADESLKFGPDYLIPKPFDPRLIAIVAPAVARAAMETGVARRPIEDFAKYEEKLNQFVFQTGMVMKPVFEKARQNPKRVIFAEGERGRILMATKEILDQGIAIPVLIGRLEAVQATLDGLGVRLTPGKDFEVIDPQSDPRVEVIAEEYHKIRARGGVSYDEALSVIRGSSTALAAMALRLGYGDAMICGRVGRFAKHLGHVERIVGRGEGVVDLSTMTAMILPKGTFFICDTHVTPNPTAEEIAEMAILGAKEVERFGMEPKVALLSYSNFGTRDEESPRKMRRALEILKEKAPDLEVDGEMHADSALDAAKRDAEFEYSSLIGQANLLVMPNLDAANITYNLLRKIGGGITIGPIMIGTNQPAHIMTNSVSVRGLVNMTALAVARAQG